MHLANKIDAYVGFNPLRPAHRNAMIANVYLGGMRYVVLTERSWEKIIL